MKVLVVYCHPYGDSLVGTLKDDVLAALGRGGHDVTFTDLYAEDFQPAMTAEERRAYESGEPVSPDVARHVQQLRAAEALVLVFPTWWYAQPAVLKGWFDRVWVPGVAFDLTADRRMTAHRLARLRRLVVVTTYGAPWAFIRLFMGEPGRRILTRGFRRLIGRGAKVDWLALYGVDDVSPRRVEAFRRRVVHALERLR